MTNAQYQRIKDLLNQKWQSGEIHADEYFDTLDLMDGNPELGAAEASRILGVKFVDDPGERATKKAEAEIEKKLKSVYGTAAKELKATLAEMEKDYDREYKKKQQQLVTGEISQEEYNTWARNRMMRDRRMRQRIDQCTGTLYHANEKAIGIVNGEQLHVFAENANYQEYQIDRDTGLNLMFTIYDEHTVERLIRDNPDLLPPKKVNEKKDKAWNQGRITNAVTQAIIQGESIPALAKRIAAEYAGSNGASMMRYARTAMTAAQNAGRQEMLQKAVGLGIKCRKRWMATLDRKTRDSHAELDGQVVEVDEKFSNGLLFPGDPNGDPGEVMNCRCTMTYEYDGIDNSLGERRDNETGKMIPDITYEEWKRMNAPEKKQKPEKKEKPVKQPERTASDYDAIMKKVEAMEDKKDDWEEGKKNLLPMADLKTAEQAHDIWLSLTDKQAENLTQLTTIEISKLKTEQAEVFTDRLEDLAEAFDGRKVSGARTDDFEGITVAKWQGEYIVLDGNNRTNLAILKGQKELEVMLIDMDGDTELRKLVEREAERRPVQGKDITGTWHRRPDEFAFEIEDVINAQGFDGLPRIMDAADFDKAVQESSFVAYRTYSAPDQETLDLYQDQLYNGKWYVDCSTGGAQYGQGMYCAADYTGKITAGMDEEMVHYIELGQERGRQQAWYKIKSETDWKQEWIDRDKREEEKYGQPSYYTRKYGMPTDKEFEIFHRFETGEVQTIRDLSPEDKKIWLAAGEKNLTFELKELDSDKYIRFREDYEGYSNVETITLTPDAKIITYEKALRTMLTEEFGEDEIKEAIEEAGGFSYFASTINDLISDRGMHDVGSWAALHGYDAINAEGHGESGSYTVILNRTKCIFRRDAK